MSDTCKSCGKKWVDHLGVQPICAVNRQLVEALKKIANMSDDCGGGCGNYCCGCIKSAIYEAEDVLDKLKAAGEVIE